MPKILLEILVGIPQRATRQFLMLLMMSVVIELCSGLSGAVSRAAELETDAKLNIGNAFAIIPTNRKNVSLDGQGTWLTLDKAKIAISKEALEKDFLLQAVSIPQQNFATGTNLKSRVVNFRLRDHRLFLMESIQSYSMSRDLPQNLILTEFPIVRESDSQIVFDFNAGMSKIFIISDWRTSDADIAVPEFSSMNIRVSYIEKAEINPNSNQLLIRQVAQTENAMLMELKYYLSPYQLDTSFEPTVAPDLERLGFFELAPQPRPNQLPIRYATKFDIREPIHYWISASTPPEYRQAVRDGILYWNKALGQEVITVSQAPEGVVAPDINKNVFQWVNSDLMPGAYADAQLDPRTGKILHAQVFFGSGLAFLSRYSLREFLRRVNSDSNGSVPSPSLGLSLKGFAPNSICNLQPGKEMTLALLGLLESGADDQTVLKVSQDYIALITAHEIGHTMGLRHNFAGSLAANYPLSQRQEIFKSYLETGSPAVGLVPTSSVMDYLVLEEAAMGGAQIRTASSSAFEYDHKAIQSLYFKKVFADQELPLFCTDSHASGELIDCTVWDAGSSKIEFDSFSADQKTKFLPEAFLEKYISAKAPAFGQTPIPLEKVKLTNMESTTETIAGLRAELLKAFTTTGRFLKIRRGMSGVGATDESKIREAELKYLLSEVERLGGIEKIFPMIPEDFSNRITSRFITLLESARSGTGHNERSYEFTDKEVDFMIASVKAASKKIEMSLIKRDLDILNREESFVGEPVPVLGDMLAELFKKRIERYAMSTTGETVVVEAEVTDSNSIKGTKRVTVNLPVFTFPLEIRLAAAYLLRESRSEALDWGLYERAQVRQEYSKLLKTTLSASFGQFELSKQPRSVAKWILENQKVAGALGAGSDG